MAIGTASRTRSCARSMVAATPAVSRLGVELDFGSDQNLVRSDVLRSHVNHSAHTPGALDCGDGVRERRMNAHHDVFPFSGRDSLTAVRKE